MHICVNATRMDSSGERSWLEPRQRLTDSRETTDDDDDDDGRYDTMGSNATGRGTTLAAALSKMQSPDKGTYAIGFFLSKVAWMNVWLECFRLMIDD